MKSLLLFLVLWAGASDVAGKWTIQAKAPDGHESQFTMELKATEGKLSGALMTAEGDAIPLADLKLDGDQLTFKVPTDEGAYETTLTVGEKEMKGTYKAPGSSTALPVTATRK